MALKIYTDGSCIGNPGKGGWGFIALKPDEEIHMYGSDPATTNNIMELTAVIEAIEAFPKSKDFHIVTDSMYVKNCAEGKWARKKNVDLWKKYDKVARGKKIIFEWVRGHNGDPYNELVDKLAKSGAYD